MHSLFGASKVAADVMVQEYGRYFGMPTVLLPRRLPDRPEPLAASSCTASWPTSSSASREGRTYRIFGYKGKQVRDNIHAYDVCRASSRRSTSAPRRGEVYNLGGGRGNSVLDAGGDRARSRQLSAGGCRSSTSTRTASGDHICYISDLTRLQAHYPGWGVSRSLSEIIDELCAVAA